MPIFEFNENRDAWAAIRGFVYQVDQTLLRWIQLGEKQRLELERGEDIDVVEIEKAFLTTEESEQKRILEQIKHRQSGISLASPVAREAIANFSEHLHRNTDGFELEFRFITNAKIAPERPPLPSGVPGIHLWEKVRTGGLSSSDALIAVGAISTHLKGMARPVPVNPEVWERLQVRLDAPAESFRAFIKRFEWALEAPLSADLQNAVMQELASKRGVPATELETAYAKLFLYVFRLLSRPGLKQLSASELDSVMASTIPSEQLTSFRMLNTGIQSLLALLKGSIPRLQEDVGHIRNVGDQTYLEVRSLREEFDARYQRQTEVQNNTSLGRYRFLTTKYEESIARCAARWQALGLPRELSFELARDQSVGEIPIELKGSDAQLVFVVGPVGSGKSLIVERLYQEAIQSAIQDPLAPIPVYLEARYLTGSILAAVESQIADISAVRERGTLVILDGLDETAPAARSYLIQQARTLPFAWHGTRVVISSRPQYQGNAEDPNVLVPELTEEAAINLVTRISGNRLWLSTLPAALAQAVRRPLFSVLYAQNQDSRSPGELLHNLVEKALQQPNSDRSLVFPALARLAVESLNRGYGKVPRSELGRDVVNGLIASGLVSEINGYLTFPLVILTQWFAGIALQEGLVSIDEIASDKEMRERWRYPLVMLVSTGSHPAIMRSLEPIAAHDPGLAAQIVSESLSSWGADDSGPPPPATECSTRLQSTMAAWISGLGHLGELIAPKLEDGSIAQPSVLIRNEWITVTWCTDERYAEIPHGEVRERIRRWLGFLTSRPGHQAGWAWRWSLDALIDRLDTRLERREFRFQTPSLQAENLWFAAKDLGISNRISLDEVEKLLRKTFWSSNPYTSYQIRGASFSSEEIQEYYNNIRSLREKGVEWIEGWPSSDKHTQGGWSWDYYSDERLLGRVRAVYEAALDGYTELVNTFFPELSTRFSNFAHFPAKLVGKLSPSQGFPGPTLYWYFEPLSDGSKSSVDINLEAKLPDWPKNTSEIFQKIRDTKPSLIRTVYRSGGPQVFGRRPAAELAYEWLCEDLRDASWSKKHFRRRD